MSDPPVLAARAPAERRRGAMRAAWPSLLLALAACAIPITFRDPVTYERLCDLKVECLDVLERADGAFRAETAEEVHRARLGLKKLLARELGKGESNAETAAQIQKLLELFSDQVEELARGDVAARLGPGYAAAARGQLAEAFDIAIETEALKNREGG